MPCEGHARRGAGAEEPSVHGGLAWIDDPLEDSATVSVNWDDLRFLLALRRAGSLSAAARELKVEASTASRRLGALENALGAQLAARTPEGLVMNDAGQLAADLALRLFRERNPSLVTRKIGEIGWSIYAARSYLERASWSPKPETRLLQGHAVVGYRGPAGRSAGATWLIEHSREEDVVLLGDSVLSVLTAVSAGLGVSVLPCFLAAEKPSLVRLVPAVVATVEAFLVIPPDHRNTARVHIVMDALAELFTRERALLGGAA